ncbi:alpha/beta hydrolase [Nocardia sp. CDC186]|uniref:Alpha/beta hydrolase n=1 Tax=Nocardia implantans TaxID=3108168 RepID=A0ABU6AMT0_9NOCA|nr:MULTISPECIES: alpha/beta hydrolase [unclassified Nocardia]MBF6191947.1 alpha/beta fold hydrolase [Nocardia beijingensis]MEA3530077.1 alpha/beta hydrolase [Nocardia sp. CDC192]MEB3508785.1 alpha/beta hydrolase [Nocardia sp. CDC186]
MSTTIARRAADHDGHRVTVSAADGVPLAVRVFGADDALASVVFVHGHCLRTESWTSLRQHLLRQWGDDVRMVFYDHRGHGESGAAHPSTYTIEQLGHDLDTVLRTVAPTGPVILVGHSMGAMVVLAYARLYPQAIGTRIAGVGLLAGAAAGITEAGLARLLHRRAVNSLQAAVTHAPRVMQASRRLTRRLFAPILREAEFGAGKVNPRMAALATAMLNDTPLVTMAGFLHSLITFDETATLHHLGAVPALVLAGSADLIFPFAHSVALASQLAGAELVRLEGAGHSVLLERADEVALSIVGLAERAFAVARPDAGYAAAG